MTREVEIRDKKTGQVLRETYTQIVPTFFGSLNLSAADVIKLVGAILTIAVFFVNGQNDKKLMQENLSAMQVTVSRLADFKDNSDGWNTQVYGTRFRNGEPVDNNFKVKNGGNL